MSLHKIKYLSALLDGLKDKRRPWERWWDKIAFLTDPRYYGKLDGRYSAPGQISIGRKKYDNTLTVGMMRWASAIEGLTTPRNETWHNLRFTDGADGYDSRVWADRTRDKLFARRYAAGSGFSRANYTALWIMGVYGTSVMGVFKRPGARVRYHAYHPTDWFLDVNAEGNVDTFMREFEADDRQLFQIFGSRAKEAFSYDNLKTKHKVVTAVIPNDYYIPGAPFQENFKYNVFSWIKDKDTVLQNSFMHVCPLICQRYEPLPNLNDPYAMSLAMLAACDQNTLNEMVRMCLRSADNQTSPVILGYQDNVDVKRFRPNTYVPGTLNEEGKPLVQPFNLGGNQPFTLEWIRAYKESISQFLGLDLFMMLASKNKQMTAEEVRHLAQEQGIMLGPLAASRESQFSEPEIEINLQYGFEDGAFDPLPETVLRAVKNGTGNMVVEYDNPINRSQKMAQINGTMQLISTAGMLDPIDPHVKKRINADRILQNTRDILGVDTEVLLSDEEVKALDEAEAAAAQQSAQAAGMLEAAQIAQQGQEQLI